MQPLGYFAVRSLLGWLQFVERQDRAFVSSAPLLVACGASHCWAVVYALFIAIHTRAMRYDGYHEGYTEHLPFWVSWTESLAVASMGIWWVAGFTTAAIRIMDDDAQGLPVEARDVNVGFFLRIVRSARLRDLLAAGHAASCAGLFASILFLCMAMALMKGFVTVCELSLCFVAMGFALPHAVLASRACRRLSWAHLELSPGSGNAVEAAAQEAAALGPQLSVILALADSPDHAFLWQNLVYVSAAAAFVVAVGACAQCPPKLGDCALPPEVGEFTTCLLLDLGAAAVLIMCFPELNTWLLWAMVVLLLVLFAAVWQTEWRDLLIDLLDPLFVIRSDTDKALPGQNRQRLRGAAWAATLACAGVALWDIAFHPLPEGHIDWPPPDHAAGGAHGHGAWDDAFEPDLWDPEALLLLRWKGPVEPADEERMLAVAAEALGVTAGRLASKAIFSEHRVLLFKSVGHVEDGQASVHLQWETAVRQLQHDEMTTSELGKIVDTSFPCNLNVSLCLQVTDGSSLSVDAPHLADFTRIVGAGSDAQAAYMAVCKWLVRGVFGLGEDPDPLSEHRLPATSATEEAKVLTDSGIWGNT